MHSLLKTPNTLILPLHSSSTQPNNLLGTACLCNNALWSSMFHSRRTTRKGLHLRASMTELPLILAVRNIVFYSLIQSGIVPSSISSSPAEQDKGESAANWLLRIFNIDSGSTQITEHMKLRRGWQTTTKGTLKRRYRVPTKAEGRRLLLAISTLLSDDDTFRDATSHKGCQIRRENAHAESVCCHNVRVLFDELPTPHLVVEIMAFPVGPITDGHFEKAEKIEKVLRTGNSI